ncbi:MAG: hypothetical protein WCE68_05535 [Anaerolineales bacterium]
MRLTQILKVICIVLLATFALVGCIASSSQIPTSTPIPPLTLDLLKNAEYRYPGEERRVRLIDGFYQESNGIANTSLRLWEQPIAFADLNGDGVEDAIVILDYNPGGAMGFPTLVIVLNQGGTLYDAAEAGLGDRTKIKNIRVDGKTITLDVVTHQPGDGLCCPTLDAIWQFRFESNKLIPLQ